MLLLAEQYKIILHISLVYEARPLHIVTSSYQFAYCITVRFIFATMFFYAALRPPCQHPHPFRLQITGVYLFRGVRINREVFTLAIS